MGEKVMKVMLLNGSPRGKMCTYTALSVIADRLNEAGAETEFFHIGAKPVAGCIGCGNCKKTGKCFLDDGVNEFVEKMKECDALIVGSPVYYASAAGQVSAFLDRAFCVGGALFAGKAGAAIVSCRRGGAATTFDQLNKYFAISNMPIVTSNYWNQVHGNTPEEILKDEEGIQTMRTLADNMLWLLSCIQAGKEKGIELPFYEPKIKTNFIR